MNINKLVTPELEALLLEEISIVGDYKNWVEYKDGIKSDTLLGYKFTILCPYAEYDKIVVKIPHNVIVSEFESLQGKYVQLIEPEIKFYIDNYKNPIPTITAQGVCLNEE